MPLFRKLSSSFKKNKTVNGNGGSGALPTVNESKASPAINGHNTNGTATNGASIGQSLQKTKDVQRASTYKPPHSPQSAEVGQKDDGAPATRKDVESAFTQFAELIHAAQRPLPTQSGDGQYLEKEEPTGFWQDLKHLGFKDAQAALHMVEDKLSGGPVDDRKMHMEEVMQLLAALPDRSANRAKLTGSLLDLLWNSLQHPPMSYLGDDFKYRSADGSNNSYIFPKLGAANTPYARSVQPKTVQPGALPDPGLLFDSLLAREEFKPHPNNVSSIFFNWASLIIHGMFSPGTWFDGRKLTSSRPLPNRSP
jgi:linoleate 10R-lipoxygenase